MTIEEPSHVRFNAETGCLEGTDLPSAKDLVSKALAMGVKPMTGEYISTRLGGCHACAVGFAMILKAPELMTDGRWINPTPVLKISDSLCEGIVMGFDEGRTSLYLDADSEKAQGVLYGLAVRAAVIEAVSVIPHYDDLSCEFNGRDEDTDQ